VRSMAEVSNTSPAAPTFSWSNWSGKLRANPSEIVAVSSEAEVVERVRRAADSGAHIRTSGSAHSHARLLPTDSILINTAALAGVVETDSAAQTAVVRAGSVIADLGQPLRAAGLALRNQGDIDRQAIAGAVATGTHGTGRALQNLSASVEAVRLVLADGEVVECDSEREPELFEVARLSLGAVGVVTELRLALRSAYKLEERMWLEPLDGVLDRIDDFTHATRHFEFFWLPGKSRAACKALVETDAEPRYPLAAEGARLAWSDEVLANDRPDKHTEMEYSLPEAAGPECFRALRELIARDFPDLAWPLEYRTLAADDVWLSTARERPTATISVHQGVELADEALFRACEEVFLAHAGRPHWGKVHYLSGSELATIHDRYRDWWQLRDRYDPRGLFLNAYLESLRP
jgi:FAD/FMN-containing dehydrogenase